MRGTLIFLENGNPISVFNLSSDRNSFNEGRSRIRWVRYDGDSTNYLSNNNPLDDNFVDVGNVTPTDMFPPELSQSGHVGNRYYLESDIIATQLNNAFSYPTDLQLDSDFLPYRLRSNEERFTRGISTWFDRTLERGDFTDVDATASYNIGGRDFTRLVGIFDFVGQSFAGDADIVRGHLRIYGDGMILGDAHIETYWNEWTIQPVYLDVAIPTEVQRVQIVIRRSAGFHFAFVDAFFLADTP
jgi:hypothetical protein